MRGYLFDFRLYSIAHLTVRLTSLLDEVMINDSLFSSSISSTLYPTGYIVASAYSSFVRCKQVVLYFNKVDYRLAFLCSSQLFKARPPTTLYHRQQLPVSTHSRATTIINFFKERFYPLLGY